MSVVKVACHRCVDALQLQLSCHNLAHDQSVLHTIYHMMQVAYIHSTYSTRRMPLTPDHAHMPSRSVMHLLRSVAHFEFRGHHDRGFTIITPGAVCSTPPIPACLQEQRRVMWVVAGCQPVRLLEERPAKSTGHENLRLKGRFSALFVSFPSFVSFPCTNMYAESTISRAVTAAGRPTAEAHLRV